MIIEQIDEKRLMIMLESNDMNSLELTYEKISWKNRKFKLLVAKLLALAKFKTGFSVDDSKLSIETIPQGDGCVIIFTLFPEIDIKSSAAIPPDTYEKVKIIHNDPFIYKFGSIDDLLDACYRLDKIDTSTINRSCAIRLDESYYIMVYPSAEELSLSVSTLLNEYGSSVRFSRTLESYLYEFGNIIDSKKAISCIASCV